MLPDRIRAAVAGGGSRDCSSGLRPMSRRRCAGSTRIGSAPMCSSWPTICWRAAAPARAAATSRPTTSPRNSRWMASSPRGTTAAICSASILPACKRWAEPRHPSNRRTARRGIASRGGLRGQQPDPDERRRHRCAHRVRGLRHRGARISVGRFQGRRRQGQGGAGHRQRAAVDGSEILRRPMP